MRKCRRERRMKDPHEDKEKLLCPHRSIVDQKTRGESILSQDHELQPDNLSIPDYVASRGARLEGILGRVSDAPLRDGNQVALPRNGPDTYDDWLAAIARAERWIHLDNYIFQDDEIGNRFADALSAKAKEGARTGAPRLVRLPGRASVLLEGNAGGGCAGQGGQPPRLGTAARCYSARPPQVDRR